MNLKLTIQTAETYKHTKTDSCHWWVPVSKHLNTQGSKTQNLTSFKNRTHTSSKWLKAPWMRVKSSATETCDMCGGDLICHILDGWESTHTVREGGGNTNNKDNLQLQSQIFHSVQRRWHISDWNVNTHSPGLRFPLEQALSPPPGVGAEVVGQLTTNLLHRPERVSLLLNTTDGNTTIGSNTVWSNKTTTTHGIWTEGLQLHRVREDKNWWRTRFYKVHLFLIFHIHVL